MWLPGGWAEYLWWQENDRKGLARVNELIRDTLRNHFRALENPSRSGEI